MHAVQFGAGDRRAAAARRRSRAGAASKRMRSPPSRTTSRAARSSAVDGRGEPQLDVVVGVEARPGRMRLLTRRLAAQVVLRQRRALVWKFRLLAYQHYAAVEALLAEGLCSFGAG